jgi:hypothetical protein
MTDRETLQQQAIELVDTALYYDLMDNIDDATDDELLDIINNTGDYAKSLKELEGDN